MSELLASSEELTFLPEDIKQFQGKPARMSIPPMSKHISKSAQT
jgi:hypothetical protein